MYESPGFFPLVELDPADPGDYVRTLPGRGLRTYDLQGNVTSQISASGVGHLQRLGVGTGGLNTGTQLQVNTHGTDAVLRIRSDGDSGHIRPILRFNNRGGSVFDVYQPPTGFGLTFEQVGSGERARFNNLGFLGVNTGETVSAQIHAVCRSDTTTGIRIDGSAVQSAPLTEWWDGLGILRARITAAGEFSHPQASESELFGAGASVGSATQSVAMGFGATVSGTSGLVAIGRNALASGQRSIAIGRNAVTTTSFATVVGDSASGSANTVVIGNSAISGSEGTAVGSGANANNASVVIGREATSSLHGVAIGQGAAANSSSIAIGRLAATTTSNQLVVGSSTIPISEMRLGVGNNRPSLLRATTTVTELIAGLITNGAVTLNGLPTSDPGVAHQLWNDGGILKISGGS